MRTLTQERARSRAAAAIAMLTALSWSCTRATDVELLEITGTAIVVGAAVLDLNGDSLLTAGDEPITDAEVVLVRVGTGEVTDQVTTDSLGIFTFQDVPVGTYTLTLDSTVLGDSLSVFGVADPLAIEVGATLQLVLGATFPTLTLEEALVAPVGSRVFTTGMALSTNPNFGDGQIHFKGDTAYLRTLSLERGVLNIGDSTRMLGHVVLDNGRPALQDVTFSVLVPQAQVIVPEPVSTMEAATADGGRLDAALARMSRAEITDTSTTVDGHFRFWADDGTDSVEVVIRDFLVPGINTSAFRPDTIIRINQAFGLLSPVMDGPSVRWQFMPRAGGDIALETKTADIQVSLSVDTTQASMGDTIEFMVAVQNVGPHTATLLQLSDTIPTGATFVSSSVTTGSYDSGTGVWDIGTMVLNAADTLRLELEVTAVGPGLVTNIAESLGLVLEVDPVPGNNAVGFAITIN